MASRSLAHRLAGLAAVGSLLVGVPRTVSGQTAQIAGVVRDQITERPVPTVSIIWRDTVVAVTDTDGRFRLTRLPSREITLTFRRIGYAPATRSLIPSVDALVEVTVVLRPVPTTLQEVVVDGRRLTFANPGLAGFYDRRQAGSGRFLTADEISRSMAFDLGYYLERRLLIRPEYLAAPQRGRGCLATYLDGVRFWDVSDVVRLIGPRQVAGMEYHRENEVHRLPPAFIPAGPHCGVLIVWTREPRGPTPWAIGFRAGVGGVGSGSVPFQVGGQLDLAFSGRVALRVGFEAVTTSSSEDRWRALFGLVTTSHHIFVGGGAMAVKQRLTGDLVARGAVFAGTHLTMGPFVPFIEARVVTSFRDVTGGAFAGASVRFTGPGAN